MISGFVSVLLAVLPLALDTFVIAAVVGASRPSGRHRLPRPPHHGPAS